MRITIVTGPFFSVPPAPCGAIEYRWLGVAKVWAAQGHTVICLSRSYGDLPAESVVNGIRIIRRGGFRQSRWIGWSLLKDMAYCVGVARRLPRADITITNAFWLPVAGAMLRRRLGRLVVNVARYPKKQMRIYRGVDLYAAPSQAVTDAIIAQCPSCRPIARTIPNPINTDVFKCDAPIGGTDGKIRILYTGRVTEEKGVHLLVKAAARLHERYPHMALRIIGMIDIDRGGGGPVYRKRLEALAGSMPLEFVPPIGNQSQLAQAMREADIYCYPSIADRGESFGVAPLEAMALGLPTVVSGLECFHQFVRDGENAIVFNHRAIAPEDELAQALERLIESSDLRRQISKAAAETGRLFGYPAIAEMYLAEFAKLLGRGQDGSTES
ncbi:MAG: glycosyltransferase family 4 protein [Phycisphaeraceae bacterium]